MATDTHALTITWLGQSGYLYRFPSGLTVCIDPYLSHAKSGGQTRPRLTPVVIPATAITAALVIITHDHIDHFDEITLRPIAEQPTTVFTGPSSCREHWLAMELPGERFLRLDQGEVLEVAGVRLTAFYAEHSSGPARDAIGVLIEAEGVRIYQTGDSEYTERLVEQARDLRPDLLAVPINGRGGNMTAAQAAALTKIVDPRFVIPMHYGMFANNTADPDDFIAACRATGIDARIIIAIAGIPFTLPAAERP